MATWHPLPKIIDVKYCQDEQRTHFSMKFNWHNITLERTILVKWCARNSSANLPSDVYKN